MPDENKLVVLVDKDDGFYNACFVDKIDWVNDWYNHIEKWCYLDVLIAQADKAERLQKAVDKALYTLDYVSNERFATEDGDFFEEYEEMHKAIKQDIDEIKQLIKE